MLHVGGGGLPLGDVFTLRMLQQNSELSYLHNLRFAWNPIHLFIWSMEFPSHEGEIKACSKYRRTVARLTTLTLFWPSISFIPYRFDFIPRCQRLP